MPILTLVSITCMNTDETDKDEIFLKVDEKKIWPLKQKFYPIDIDEDVSIQLKLNVSVGLCNIELWEFDFIGSNELLGSFEFKTDKTGSYSEMMSNHKGDSSYILNYEIN